MANILDVLGITGNAVERAKAALFAQAGRFLQKRDQILKMRDVVDAVQRKGETSGNPTLADLARQLMAQIDKLYGTQVELEQRVQVLAGAFAAPAAGPAAMIQTAAAAAPLLRDLGVHLGKVSAVQSAVDALKRRTLTAAELARIGRPELFAGGLGIAGLAVVGVGAYLVLRRRRS